jgi:tetratricopeptide (TPR) repeat protein
MNRLIRYCDGLIEAAWLLVIIYVPLYFFSEIEQPFGVGKTVMFRALILVGVAAWITKWISAGVPRFEPISLPVLWKKITSQPLALLAGAVAAVYALSTAFSIAPLVSLRGSYVRGEGLVTLLFYILSFALVAANLRRRKQVDRLCLALTAVSFAVDLYAIWQHFGLDPISRVSPVTSRAVSTLGQPIFLAAFLGMTLMIMLGRVVFLYQTYRQATTTLLVFTRTLIALYLIVCALNMLAIWYAVARGPLIALFFGLFFFGFALLAYWQLRRTFYVFASTGIVLLVFMGVLNIPNGPLSGLRDNPIVGPLGHVFDKEQGTGRLRVLIWNGMLRLVTPHDPIQLPDTHSGDRLNAIRPLIGYGPETISLVYESFYLPEMFPLEYSYDLTYDHSHNEFWDDLALYGLLGFLAEYGLFLSLFYFGLKWLGWISSDSQSKLYWLLSLLGGLLGGIVAFMTSGAEFLGVGIPMGLLLGVVVVLFLRIFRRNAAASKPDLWRDMILISALALIVFHYVEILFGIPVNATRILFWITCGVMLVVGQGMLMKPEKTPDRNDTRQVWTRAGIMIAIVMALTPTLFILNDEVGLDAPTIIVNSLVSKSFGILWIFLGIVFFTCLLFELDAAVFSDHKPFFSNFLSALGITIFASFLMWMPYAGQLAALRGSLDLRPDQVITLYLSAINIQFGALVIFAYAWAFLLSEPIKSPTAVLKPLVIASFGLIHILALILSLFMNLRPLQANGMARLFNSYMTYGQNLAAVETGKKLLELDPQQDIYFLGVADFTIKYAGTLTFASQQNAAEYVLTADKYYKQAYALNPFLYRNVLGMAHIYTVWARVSPEPVARQERLAQAEQFYAQALEGKPYRVKLWVEWAGFREEFGDLQGSRQRIDAALKIDNTYTPAYAFSADLYLKESENQDDPAKRAELWGKAVKDLTTAIEIMNRSNQNPSLMLLQLGDVRLRLQKYDQAREAYLQAERLGLGDSQWQAYQKLAEVSGRMNDIAAQREYLKQAIAVAPAIETPALQAALDSLKP